jgi:predicted acyltransferase
MAEKKRSARLVSLVIFSGLTIAGMILVNHPGSWRYVCKPLGHAAWHGWTPTDLIFPFFLFIVGIAIKLSLDKVLLSGRPLADVYLRIARRTLLLLLLGVSMPMFWGFEWSTLRFPGVLQRIALCYLAASLLYIQMAKIKRGAIEFSPGRMAWLVVGLLFVYYLAMRFIPVPGYGAGLLDSKQGNLAAYLDRLVFGNHLWSQSKTWDPEGLLTTLPAIGTTLIGVIAAWWLGAKREAYHKLAMLLVAGNLLMLSGYLVSGWFPINKNLWSPSYVLFSGGMALVFLGICYWYADIKGYRRLTMPWLVYGMNAIAVYYLSAAGLVLLSKLGLWGKFYTGLVPIFGNYGGSAVAAVCYVLLWMGFAWLLYRKRIFIKV